MQFRCNFFHTPPPWVLAKWCDSSIRLHPHEGTPENKHFWTPTRYCIFNMKHKNIIYVGGLPNQYEYGNREVMSACVRKIYNVAPHTNVQETANVSVSINVYYPVLTDRYSKCLSGKKLLKNVQ